MARFRYHAASGYQDDQTRSASAPDRQYATKAWSKRDSRGLRWWPRVWTPFTRDRNATESVELLNEPATLTTAQTLRAKESPSVSQSDLDRTSSNIRGRLRRSQPWRPVMLRLPSLLALATVCLALIALLEVLDTEVRRHQGINTDNVTVVNCLRYVPTAAIVVLGFVWRSLVSDLKLIMPWSAMTNRTVPLSESLQSNYINSIELLSIWTAARRRHWPLCVGLLGALVAAVLVSFTNALTYVNPLARITQNGVGYSQTTDWDFKNRLVDQNGSLNMAWDYTGSQPYAALTSAQQENGQYPPWTTDGYAFTEFIVSHPLESTSQHDASNGTLTAPSTAFSAGLNCTPIRMSVINPPDWTMQNVSNGMETWWRRLQPNDEDLNAVACQNPSPITLTTVPGLLANSLDAYDFNVQNVTAWSMVSAGTATPAAWLNLTTCGPPQARAVKIWANMLRPAGGDPTAGSYDVRSLLCEAQYTTQNVSLSVNTTSGDVLSYVQLASSQPYATGITPDVLLTYLNNPLDGTSLDAYQQTSWQGSLSTNTQIVTPQVSFVNVTNWADYYFGTNGQDNFFAQMLNTYDSPTIDAFFNSNTLFANQVSGLVGNYMTQLANTMARKNISTNALGTTALVQPRILLRQWALRAAQASLGILAAICLLLMTGLRVISCLSEDCGNLAAIAVILANESTLEHLLINNNLADVARVGATGNFDGTGAVRFQILGRAKMEREQRPGTDRFRPTALHWLYISITLLVGLGLLAAAAATLHEALGGMIVSKASADWLGQSAWAFVPTVVLLLLGYCLGGLSDAVTLLQPYRNLQQQEGAPGRKTVLFNPINHSVFSLPYRAVAGLGSLVLLWTSLIILVYPGVKIAAAGLYTASTTDYFSLDEQMALDTSLTDRFEQTFPLDNQASIGGMTDRASQWSEWSQISQFNLPPRTDVLDNLVFSQMQGSITNATSIHAVVPAVEVNVSCTPYNNDAFTLWASQLANSYWPAWAQTKFMFRPKTAAMNASAVSMVDYDSLSMMQNSIGLPKYIGAGFLPLDTAEDGTNTIRSGTPYTMMLADYSTVSPGVVNETYVPAYTNFINNSATMQSIAIEAKPGMFNATLPTLRGVVCTRDFNRITVNVTLTQGIRAGLNGSSTLLPWAVSAYDASSITARTPYNRSTPGWMYPYYPTLSTGIQNSNLGPIPAAASGGNAAETVGDTLWPAKGTSRNIWEQLAVYQESKVGNDSLTSSLMNVTELASSVEAVLLTYSVQMLSELRSYTSQLAGADLRRTGSINNIPVQVHRRVPAVTQSANVTYAISAMLATVIICAVLAAAAYLPLPGRKRRTVDLREQPGSIAAAMTLLAGSNLVRILREEGVTRTDQTQVWERRFRLGWWDAAQGNSDTAYKGKGHTETRRWGIDVVP